MEAKPTSSLEGSEIKLKKKKNKFSRKSCFTAWCAILLLILTWIGLFLSLSYFWLQTREKLTTYQNRQSFLQTQILKDQVDNKNLQQQIRLLENFIEQKFSNNNNKIMLANAKQLIQLAQYNLVYFHDINNALSSLTLAHNQLSLIISPDTRLENLRQLLNQYLTRLKALPHTDLNVVLNQIESLKKQVSQLPLLSVKNTPSLLFTHSTVNNSSENKWIQRLRDSLNSFRQLIVIRRLNKPIEPLLPETEQRYLQQNLRLLLQQTQWAFIHHEAIIYQTSLQEFQTIIMDHFPTNSSLTQTVNQLKQIDLQTPLLDLNSLLENISTIEKKPINSTPTITANQKEPS